MPLQNRASLISKLSSPVNHHVITKEINELAYLLEIFLAIGYIVLVLAVEFATKPYASSDSLNVLVDDFPFDFYSIP